MTFKLFLLTALAACGAPGGDAVFTKGNPKIATPDSARSAAAPPAPRIQPKRYTGYYRRLSGESQFRPCGTDALLDVIGTPDARLRLSEAFRWNSVWQGRKMFGIFQGAIVTDTPRTTGAKADTAPPVPRRRFFITDVDSLRTWQSSDCGGMRIP
jgi:hypothetical protein